MPSSPASALATLTTRGCVFTHTLSKSAVETSEIFLPVGPTMPAQLITMSSLPNVATACSYPSRTHRTNQQPQPRRSAARLRCKVFGEGRQDIPALTPASSETSTLLNAAVPLKPGDLGELWRR